MVSFTSLICGLLFGAGLMISGMANPQKVLGFLSITREWDPSLLFVMGGAIFTGLIAFRLALRRGKPVLCPAYDLPAKTHPDTKLVTGAVLFGVGWGLAGICPGPALILVASGIHGGLMFFVAMLAGMGIFELTAQFSGRKSKPIRR